MDVERIEELYGYHAWANRRVLDAASALTREQFIATIPSSYPSVGDTLVVRSLTEELLAAVIRYVNRRGETWEYELWKQMLHVVNHSSYHRGQVITMLRQLGAPPPTTDFLVFYDEMGA
jgi:uncharacterized damage-inducible protein DinB